MDVGLLIIRVVVGTVLLVHGLQWLFGWFGGAGLSKAATIFESWGLRPAPLMVLTTALVEIAAGLGLVAGFLTPIAATAGAANMVVAGITLHLNKGTFWNAGGGGEFPYVLAAMCLAIGIMGPGAFSVDNGLAAGGGFWAFMVAPPVWLAFIIVGVCFLAALPFVGLIKRSATPAAPPTL